MSPQARSILLFILLWQFTFNVSDAAVSLMVVFIYHLLRIINSICKNDIIAQWIETFPVTLHGTHKKIIANDISFTEYVVCLKCHSLYDRDSCIIVSGSNKYSRKCEYIQFPNHPQRSYREPCGTILMKSIRKTSGITFKPFKTYSYQSIRDAILRLLKRPGFLEDCEHWRKRVNNRHYLADIYDGDVWNSFFDFLSTEHSWCLALNVDWFQPYTHVTDSVGAMYLVVLNLPREERYKRENMLMVGIIPGPNEPSLDINSYLTPLVLELKEFYNGIPIQCTSHDGKYINVTVRLALAGVMCDLPASRKVCGFSSFNALHGCNKCLKEFPTQSFGDSPDYSGYNRMQWGIRDVAQHKVKCYEYLNANTKQQQKSIQKEYGIRYSILIELPYFNPIKHTVIDPMHNLFLGTAKHCLQLWIKKEILTKSDIDTIEQLMLQLYAPHSVGRLPRKIGSGFSGFTADQWKNWTIQFSPVVLRGVLPAVHLQYWLLFVKACTLLCTRCLLKENINLADQYFHMFCVKFLNANGPTACTPNMHLHLHLKECFDDYGPPHAFWCYAFERHNGMLGSFPNNQKNIEPQLMKKCLILQELHSKKFPSEGECFRSLLEKHSLAPTGSLMMSMKENVIDVINLATASINEGLNFSMTGYEKILPPVKNIVLTSDMVASLQLTYKLIYPGIEVQQLQRFAKKLSRVAFVGEVFGSMAASRDNNTVISARWPTTSQELLEGTFTESIGRIQFFIQHKILNSDGNNKEHLFAYVHWQKKHPQYDWFGSSAIVCSLNKEEDNSYAFIPVQRIFSLCIYGKINVSFSSTSETIFVAVPTQNRHHF